MSTIVQPGNRTKRSGLFEIYPDSGPVLRTTSFAVGSALRELLSENVAWSVDVTALLFNNFPYLVPSDSVSPVASQSAINGHTGAVSKCVRFSQRERQWAARLFTWRYIFSGAALSVP